jgi:hypothetical protein
MESVTLFVPGDRRERRELQPKTMRPTTASPAKVSSLDGVTSAVTGTCRGCPVTSSGSFSLFDDAFRRRRLQNDLTTEMDLTTTFVDPTERDICTCPTQAGQLGRMLQGNLVFEPNAPTEEEFLFAYNVDVERLVAEGVIINIVAILALAEVPVQDDIAVLCSPNIQEFVTYVEVEFNGNPGALTPMETAILGMLFEQVYNQLSFDNCDGYFRMTDATALVLGANTYYFMMGATCRDCPINNDSWFSAFAVLWRQENRG